MLLFACGDDDDGTPANDMRKDGGRLEPDARVVDGGGSARDASAPEPVEVCPRGECDLLDPDSCGSGEGCVFAPSEMGTAAVGPMCATVGSRAEGESCTASSDCGPGLDCSAFDGSGRCRNYCCALSRTLDCPDGQFCRLNLDPARDKFKVGLCDACDGCDPLDPDSCRPGLSCYPLPGSLDCTACLPPGKGEPGDECELSTDCARGSACFRLDNDDSLCIAFCELDGDEGCNDAKRECSEVAGAKLPPGIALCL
ncbi:MAG TPA: hypothetical protein VK509_02005 [Polyangiales bacterium]|nr:hypothetical protein [Polyangiales bacterium]